MINDANDMEDTTYLVYICSPHTGNPREAEFFDRFYCHLATGEEATPIAPYLFFPQYLDVKTQPDKEISRRSAMDLLCKCKEMWVIKEAGMTAEMAKEIRFAKEHGIPIRFRVPAFVDIEPDEIELEEFHLLRLLKPESK